MRTKKVIYQELVELLSLKQYMPLMFKDMSYDSKFERAKKVTKNKKALVLINEGLSAPISDNKRSVL